MTRSSSCPSVFALQRFTLAGEDRGGDIGAHVSSCPDCQALARQHEQWGAEYISSPAARSLGQRLAELEGARSPQRDGSTRAKWAWLGSLAAAAALALTVTLSGDPHVSSDDAEVELLRPKGGAQLSLWVGDEGRVQSELDEGAVLSPGDRVQVVFGGTDQGFVAVFVTTPAGQLIRVHPATGVWAAALEPGAPAPLGPSFRLDEETGRYEVTVYFAETKFPTAPLVDPRGLVLTRRFEVRR